MLHYAACHNSHEIAYHALFVIFEKAAKFEIVVCCNLKVALYGYYEQLGP